MGLCFRPPDLGWCGLTHFGFIRITTAASGGRQCRENSKEGKSLYELYSFRIYQKKYRGPSVPAVRNAPGSKVERASRTASVVNFKRSAKSSVCGQSCMEVGSKGEEQKY